MRAVNILGIPVNNIDLIAAVEKIMDLVYKNPIKDIALIDSHKPAYVSILDSNLVSQVHSWRYHNAYDPELLEILRRSEIVLSKTASIQWLSRILGNPLKEAIPGKELIPLLAEVLGERKKSLFILGGEEKIAKRAAEKLKTLNPGLNIVGVLCPTIFTTGEELSEAHERDLLRLEEINRAKPDVLLVNLGSPKQEVWFERVRKYLKVPVVIGVGGALQFLGGKRTMQIALSDFFDHLKVIWQSILLIPYHHLNSVFAKLGKGRNKVLGNLLFLSEKKSIAVVQLPKFLNRNNCETVEKRFKDAYGHDFVLFDMRQTRHMDLEGLSLIVNAWHERRIFGLGVPWHLKLLLRLHKVWDVVSDDMCHTPREAVSRMDTNLFEAVHQEKNRVTLSFLGPLDNQQNFETYYQKFVSMIHDKHCTIDFTYCTTIDNSGISFLLKLKRIVKSLRVIGLDSTLKRQLKIAKVEL